MINSEKEILHNLYWNKNMTLKEIGDIYNITQQAIHYKFKKYNIKRRTYKQAFSLEKTKELRRNNNLGEKNPNWRGDNITDRSVRKWLRRNIKQPDSCEKCNKEREVELSFNHKLGNHTRNIKDYEWLCHSCHMKKDNIIYNIKKMKHISVSL